MAELACDVPAPAAQADVVTALLVDADRRFVQFAREELNQTRGQPVCLLHASTLAQANAILAGTPVAVVLLDRSLPDGDGLEWLSAHRARLQAAVLVLAGEHHSDDPLPVAAGAQDLLVKSHLDGDHLAHAIRVAAERERTRQQLLQGREHVQALIEHARDLIAVVDEDGRVVYESPAAAMLLGTSPHASHRGVFAELVHPEDAGRARLLIDQVFGGDRTARGEFRLPHADGSLRTFDVIASVMSPVGEGRRVVLNARDITERCLAEEALRVRETQLGQAQKMEAVGRLAGGIAHDFSNVLTVISAACERMQDSLAQGRPDPAHAQVILRHCARAAALTRQLLAFSRHQTVAPRIVDLGALVGRATELIAPLLGAQVAVDVEIAADLRTVEVDPGQMEQVLMNLAINARDAMPEGGLLRVVAQNVTVTPTFAAAHPTLAPGEYVRLDVIDNGQGMAPDTLARAFEPFFTTKDPGRGTGLGLATVYGIVTQSRGYVSLESARGCGTRFGIYLPAREEHPAGDEPQSELLHMAEPVGSTILLTEDDSDLRRLLSEMLSARGYVVLEAGSPAEAGDVVAEHGGPIDLLVTDLVMPGGSGRELARQMTARRPELKVLYISGDGEPGPDRRVQLEPGDPFLAKPFSRQQLLQAIASLLR